MGFLVALPVDEEDGTVLAFLAGRPFCKAAFDMASAEAGCGCNVSDAEENYSGSVIGKLKIQHNKRMQSQQLLEAFPKPVVSAGSVFSEIAPARKPHHGTTAIITQVGLLLSNVGLACPPISIPTIAVDTYTSSASRVMNAVEAQCLGIVGIANLGRCRHATKHPYAVAYGDNTYMPTYTAYTQDGYP